MVLMNWSHVMRRLPAVSSVVNGIPRGFDCRAVEAIVVNKLDEELDDKRMARNDAIDTAVNAETSAIIMGRKGAIDAVITTERAAIDRSVDSKTNIIDARVTTLDDKLETERNDCVVAITAEARKRDTALMTVRTTREAAIIAESDARHSAIHAQHTELKNAIANIITDLEAHIATIIQTERDARWAADRSVTTRIANSGFPSGTKMLFRQSNAPTGWTKDTAHNDKALRVVSGSARSGGSYGFSSRFGRGIVSVASTISGNTGGHAITEAQMPYHNHGIQKESHHAGWRIRYMKTGT